MLRRQRGIFYRLNEDIRDVEDCRNIVNSCECKDLKEKEDLSFSNHFSHLILLIFL